MRYDANGNIQRFLRYGLADLDYWAMDSLSYTYYPGTNQLQRVRDNVPKDRFGSQSYDKVYDIDDQDSVFNYKYDSIGNLIEDKAEKITSIQWNVYGKITEIRRNASITDDNTTFWTKYKYDAQGNRIAKERLWYDKENRPHLNLPPGYQRDFTWYVRDAQGNQLSTYSTFTRDTIQDNLANLLLQQEDIQIYGSSRLGMYRPTGRNVDDTTSNPTGPGIYYPFGMTHYRGDRQYELTNHLGNVLTTISDRKIGVYSGSSLIIDTPNNISIARVDFYEAEKKAAFDYFPFGMIARVNDGSGKYRFGFNGQEMSNEIKGFGNSYTAQFWEYDPRIGRRWNVDPRPVSGISPYSAFQNNPIIFSDPLGDTSVQSAAGLGAMEIDEKTTSMTFYESSKMYHMRGSKTPVPVKAGQLRSFTNVFGTFSARWVELTLGVAGFDGYKNEEGLTFQEAIDKFTSRLDYRLLSFGNAMYESSQRDPVGHNLKITTEMLLGWASGPMLEIAPAIPSKNTIYREGPELLEFELWWRPLRQQMYNGKKMPLPDPEALGYPHSVFGGKWSNSGHFYKQGATFNGSWPKANGHEVPISNIHWHHHGRPWDHAIPHQHPIEWNGQQWMQQKGPGIPLFK